MLDRSERRSKELQMAFMHNLADYHTGWYSCCTERRFARIGIAPTKDSAFKRYRYHLLLLLNHLDREKE